MKLIVALSFFLFLARNGSCVEFEDCSSDGEIYSVEINHCPKEYCAVEVGTVANVTVTFATNVPANTISERAYLVISEVEHDAVVKPEPCIAFNDPGCPLKTGDQRIYRAQVTISKDTPPVRAELIWMLQNDMSNLIACFATRIHLTRGPLGEDPKGHPRQRGFRSEKP